MSSHTYSSPLGSRYASKEMLSLFSPFKKISLWRELWIALAKAEKELGLDISDQQIAALEKYKTDIDFDVAQNYEKVFRHDVMAHVHTYGDKCPEAKSIIHLGATSCYITDNADLLQMKEGLSILKGKLVQVIRQLQSFAEENASVPCLGFTHFQAAQPTTVGKRACLWMQDYLLDLQEIQYRIDSLRFLGVKGTTGTQASFLALFGGDHQKVIELDERVTAMAGFSSAFLISGQTYTRKQDIYLLNVLADIAATSHKFATDLRLLANLKEIEEPFEDKQIGSSAMPYKRNPMRAERICSLSRFILSLAENPKYTFATQWLERTLDDSANRRLSISESFLATDALLNLLINVTDGLVTYPKMMTKHLNEELPFMATENIMMHAVQKGGDRQELHEKLRQHSHAAAAKIKQEGADNDLLERIAQDPAFQLSENEIKQLVDVSAFIGRAPEQTHHFIKDEVLPELEKHQDTVTVKVSIEV